MTEIESTKSEIRSTKQIQMSGNETTECSKQPDSARRFGISRVLGLFGCYIVSDFEIRISDFRFGTSADNR